MIDLFEIGIDKPMISNLCDLIMLGNRGINLEEAVEILEVALSKMTLKEVYVDISRELIGTDRKSKNTDEELNSLSEVYKKQCMSLMRSGVSWSEYWSMTTREAFEVSDTIVDKTIEDINEEYIRMYNQSALIGSAVWGSLPKKAPKVEIRRDRDGNIISEDSLKRAIALYEKQLEEFRERSKGKSIQEIKEEAFRNRQRGIGILSNGEVGGAYNGK